MNKSKIPPRNPIGDLIHGTLLKIEEQAILAFAPLPQAQIVHQGDMIIRYGVQYLMKEHSIVPGLIASEYGAMLTGEEAWHFLFKRSNLHPRADVIGYRDDGEDDMVTIKSLDLMRPLDILAYADDEATQPIAKISAIITVDLTDLPERLREYSTIYPTLKAWQEATS